MLSNDAAFFQLMLLNQISENKNTKGRSAYNTIRGFFMGETAYEEVSLYDLSLFAECFDLL